MQKILSIILLLLLAASIGYCQERNSLAQQYSETGIKLLPVLKDKLTNGTPSEKEEVVDIFMQNGIVELIPDIINAILDNTPLPKHDDTGWGNVYHQAATALGNFAYKIDGIDQKQRGLKQFSFYDDSGTASEQRRQEVYHNWLKWWEQNKAKVLNSKPKE